MRHLDAAAVIATLKRGRSVESFLGSVPGSKALSVRYVELRPASQAVEVWVHDLEDRGSEEFTDLVEFPRLDGEDPDAPNARFNKAEEALAYAEKKLGAAPNRWTNAGVCHDDYADFVRAGRPIKWPVA